MPIRYETQGRDAHRISVIDVDKRDIEIQLWLDDVDRGYRTVNLDPTVDCGRDIPKCLELGFGSGVLDIPPGKHVVRAEIHKREHLL